MCAFFPETIKIENMCFIIKLISFKSWIHIWTKHNANNNKTNYGYKAEICTLSEAYFSINNLISSPTSHLIFMEKKMSHTFFVNNIRAIFMLSECLLIKGNIKLIQCVNVFF